MLGGCRKNQASKGSQVTVVPLAPAATTLEEERKENTPVNLVAQAVDGNFEPLRNWLAKKPGDEELYQALRLAVKKASLPVVRLLVGAGADVNHDPGNPILLLALRNADTEEGKAVARFLADQGADTSWRVQAKSDVDSTPPELIPCNCLPELCGRDFPPPNETLRFGPYRYEEAVQSDDCGRYYKTARIVDERTGEVVFQDATSDWIKAEEVELTGQPPNELYVYVYYQGGSSGTARIYAWTRDTGEPRNILAESFGLQKHPVLADLNGNGAVELAVTSCYHIPWLALGYAVCIPEFYGYDARLGRMVHKAKELRQIYCYLAAKFFDEEIPAIQGESDSETIVNRFLQYWALSRRAGRGDRALDELREALKWSNNANYLFEKTVAGINEIAPTMEKAMEPRHVLGEEGAPPFKSENGYASSRERAF